ncbi:hypothetical protein CYLTODRAFT_31414 [Cylindrobasidium torrendii FP15055 ss-10]|uniref:Uncharacterized protein n=1 Tax=Cylindrobasidium torrendii FP15055 ss-10 TaxID=1314674 RepID=A0A0D7B7N9_9AGAR|nr:hypothetical protein CYLTODRAFT_31414 [Cylindrobasidium torrendii FP15055 ss-10]
MFHQLFRRCQVLPERQHSFIHAQRSPHLPYPLGLSHIPRIVSSHAIVSELERGAQCSRAVGVGKTAAARAAMVAAPTLSWDTKMAPTIPPRVEPAGQASATHVLSSPLLGDVASDGESERLRQSMPPVVCFRSAIVEDALVSQSALQCRVIALSWDAPSLTLFAPRASCQNS